MEKKLLPITVELPEFDHKIFHQFLDGYVQAMLWSSTDDSTPEGGEPMDSNYGPDDLAPETLARITADCLSFWLDHNAFITDENLSVSREMGCSVDAYAGHDFWLTRCGHGAGFWDGDWSDYTAKRMTAASEAFGNLDPYIGDDGKIYLA